MGQFSSPYTRVLKSRWNKLKKNKIKSEKSVYHLCANIFNFNFSEDIKVCL